MAYYTDEHSVFRVGKKEAAGGTGPTQFGRALHNLNVDIIYAHSSQTKVRVERMNQTLQERLVKELRLVGIDTIDAHDNFLPCYVKIINAKSGKEPLNATDLRRPLTELDDLEESMCWQEKRICSNSLSVQFDRVMFILEPGSLTNEQRRERVTIFDYPNGTIAVKHDGASLPYSTFDKFGNVKKEDIVDDRRDGAVLAFAQAKQVELGTTRGKKVPWRKGQTLTAEQRARQRNPAVR